MTTMDTCIQMECESIDPDNQMTALEDEVMEGGGGELSDKVEELRNSLREIVQDQAVQPKLHCLMMDPSFSMVTVQSEDSGIVWETASSRCSTPWASEASPVASEACYSFAEHSVMPRSGTAGKIIFIMDEDNIVRRKTKRRNKSSVRLQKLPAVTDVVLVETDRPAMVEVSQPNVKNEEAEDEAENADPDEKKEQHLFQLVSEGSEILNIMVPPKLSTVDEEESKELVDNLSYLNEAPMPKPNESTEETEETDISLNLEIIGKIKETAIIAEDVTHLKGELPQVIAPVIQDSQMQGLAIKTVQKGSPKDTDYFEKFTLLDEHMPGSLSTEALMQELGTVTEEEIPACQSEAPSADTKPTSENLLGSTALTGPEIEHLDEVFYGSGYALDSQEKERDNEGNNEGDLPSSPLKKSGSALFGSQESILRPIFLSPGPAKIIDLSLLEEPKAMAFLYSDLYADAVGSRQRQEDVESITSEKSFHSKESDSEDRGYLEKFVLKDDTPVVDAEVTTEVPKEDRLRVWSQDTFGLGAFSSQLEEEEEREVNDPDEVTDFFRNSASSSPCEGLERDHTDAEEKTLVLRTRRVAFEDEISKDDSKLHQTGQEVLKPLSDETVKTPENITVAEEALADQATQKNTPEGEAPTSESTSPAVILEPIPYSKSDNIQHPTAHGKSATKNTAKIKIHKESSLRIQISNVLKPVTTNHRPFLDLTPLIPAETLEEQQDQEDGTKGKEENTEGQLKNHSTKVEKALQPHPDAPVSTEVEEEATAEALDYELITQQEISECLEAEAAVTELGTEHEVESTDNGGFDLMEMPNQTESLSECTVEADFEIVDVPEGSPVSQG